MQKLIVWWFFTIRGWKVAGTFPFELKKTIIVVAPHTHIVDFFLGLAVRKKMHFEFVHFIGKKELFVGIIGVILRKLGGIAIERGKNLNQVEQVIRMYNENESFHIAISPEGTRKKVNRLKSGFYHISRNTQVPIVLVALDFKNKVVVFGEPFLTTADEIADKRKIVGFFKGIVGFIPKYSITTDIEG